MRAESREEVFAALRERGIKAIKVVAADGSKANGEVRGIRKRILALAVILAMAVSGVSVFLLDKEQEKDNRGRVTAFDDPKVRQQVKGDVALIEKGMRTGWSDVFSEDGERFLASFALPGVQAGQRNTTCDELQKALNRTIAPHEGDSVEVRQIKALVEIMKSEARAYVEAGGSLVEYGKRLTERQDDEIAFYKSVKEDLDGAKFRMDEKEFLVYWEKRNEELRNRGIRLIPLPE